jgi:hypothetical protein
MRKSGGQYGNTNALHFIHIASLMRTHTILTGNSNDTAEAITDAIQAVAKEFNIL